VKYFLAILTFISLFLLPGSVSAQIYTTDKLIAVDTGSQTLTAWEGGKILYQTKVSTGLPLSPTVKGSFKVYKKVPLGPMRGYSPYVGRYNYANVPNSLYFYQGYAVHGAYWHNSFGTRRSNGCVNLPLPMAQTIYDWAPLGTRVEVW
jgi:lipoprotein-anchoring transpeptidase ErfK/SrfK